MQDDTYEEQSVFGGDFDLGDEIKSSVVDLSLWSDIMMYRVKEDVPKADKKYFQMLKDAANMGYGAITFPNKDKYAAVVGGQVNFEKLAKEGNEYNWQEAFAAAEAYRIGALPGLKYYSRQPGDADCTDSKDRPLDVKMLPPDEHGFSAKRTLTKRIQGKGGYVGDKTTYPAIIIFDTSFASPERRKKKLLTFYNSLTDKTQVWRVIQIHVAYEGEFAEYSVLKGNRPAF